MIGDRTNWLQGTGFKVVLVIYPGTTLWKWMTGAHRDFAASCEAPFSAPRRFNTVFAAWLESKRLMSLWPDSSRVVMEDVR